MGKFSLEPSPDITEHSTYLATHFLAHHSSPFCPTVEFYNRLATDEGLSETMNELFRWLGMKPRHLRAAYDNVMVYTDYDVINIPQGLREHPYQAGAQLGLRVLEYVLEHHTTAPIDGVILELVSLDAGLGILVLNGVANQRQTPDNVYHFLHEGWLHRHNVQLKYIKPREYAQLVIQHNHQMGARSKTWFRYTNRPARRLLRMRTIRSHHAIPALEVRNKQSARRWWLHTILLATLIACTTTLILYIMAQ